MLFRLSPEEGWTRIDRALRGVANDEQWAAIEETVKQEHLSADLLSRLHELREENQDYVAYRGGYRAATDAVWWNQPMQRSAPARCEGELHPSFVRGWEDGKAAVTPPHGPVA